MALLVWHFKGTKQPESNLCPLALLTGLPLGYLFLVDPPYPEPEGSDSIKCGLWDLTGITEPVCSIFEFYREGQLLSDLYPYPPTLPCMWEKR